MRAAVNAPRPADALAIGGVQRFTSIDFPGALAAVVFVQGCPWRCVYCHNPQLQPRVQATPVAGESAAPGWAELRPWLQRRAGVLDALVFSGGEPTLDPALPAAMAEARALGLRIGLHSAGLAPRRLQTLLPLVDWVGLDIKAPLDDEPLQRRIAGARSARGVGAAVRESLHAVLASGVAHECRTTTHVALLEAEALPRLAAQLRASGARQWALQACRERDGSTSWPDVATLQALQQAWPGLVLRPPASA